MAKNLERDLGLYATITISIGAMIGSGIFVLPGLAAAKTGPSVILAYLLAGIIVLPAALSKAEMATAIPEAGGTYLFIDRAMGPLPGTIAGIGAWFSLVFKSAFALVGLGAYLLLLIDIPTGVLTFVGIGLGVLLIAVNIVGVKQTGRLQAGIVSFVLLVLVGFVAEGITYVDHAQYHPFLTHGDTGLLAATGFVFVSYAGVTKIASVAEEVENPGRNIPIAILVSVLVMMLVYTLTVFVIVGVVPAPELQTGHSLTPMALAAESFAGPVGGLVLAIVAVLALTSMANAGILSSSRYPLAMSRDSLAPPQFSEVSERFKTPIYSIGFTGLILLVLIAFVPVVDLAKLASAFQILVFVFINGALIAFRESDLEWYSPEFTAPGYPLVQGIGALGGLLLLTQMGVVALGGALGIILFGLAWYRFYGLERTEREGAALDAIRRSESSQTLIETERAVADGDGHVLVAMDVDTSVEREQTLLRLAACVAQQQGGTVHAIRFEEVPDQLPLSSATELTMEDRQFEAQTRALADELPVRIEASEVVSHDIKKAVINYADDLGVELILGEWRPEHWHAELLGSDVDWFMKHAPCSTTFVQDRGLEQVDEIAVLTQRRPYEPTKVAIANAIASVFGATIRFVTAVDSDVSDEQLGVTRAFLTDLEELCSVETESEIIRVADTVDGLVAEASTADLAILGTVAHSRLHEMLLGDPATEISSQLDCSVLLVHPPKSRGTTLVQAVVERVAY
ncbi:universal stress protein [Haladaptatus sp. AB618]|uniref:universal stress protein n=1 Tax=Haladaptatus sp. AB618 TaxID=2934173 RepID=UPI00209C67C0|nr:universal stress protein [Haladaptatus sp. AB618]MCO8255735.1 universal stress protein [Haladaptatus sp. AB618]